MEFDLIKKIVVPNNQKTVGLVVLSDLHIGHINHDKQAYDKNIGWLKEPDNKRWLILTNGDLIECATKRFLDSQILTINEQSEQIINDFTSFSKQKRLLGMVEGNHEQRTVREMPFSIHRSITHALKTSDFGMRALIKFEIKRRNSNKTIEYIVYMTHGSGSARTHTGKFGKLMKMSQIIVNPDIIVIGHIHTHDNHFRSPYVYNTKSGLIEQQTIHYCVSGHCLTYGKSYAEGSSYEPTGKANSRRIEMYVDKKKVLVR